MNGAALITSTLAADSAVVAIVGTRIGPKPRVPREETPCVTYHRVGDTGVYSHSGSSGLRYARYYVKGWAIEYEDAQDLGDAIRPALEGVGCMVETIEDAYEEDTGLHAWVAQVRVAEADAEG